MEPPPGEAAVEVDEAAVRDSLRHVFDPELGVNIVDLGLVRAIRVEGSVVTIDLVVTVPGCPLAGWILDRVRMAAEALPGVDRVHVTLLDEPWGPSEIDWASCLR